MEGYSEKSKFHVLVLFILLLFTTSVYAGLIAYDPFLNVAADNDKLNGEYNAGSKFRDFTNGYNADVAGGPIKGWSSANLWEGNSGASTGTFTHIIGPTDPAGLSFGLNDTTAGNVQARGYDNNLSYARRKLDSYTPSNTYYMSALVRADNLADNLSIQAMTGFSVTISYGTFDGTSSFPGAIFGFSGDGSQVDLVVRHRDNSAAMTNTTLLSNAQEDETYFIVTKIEFDADGTNERLTAWINPTEYNENDATPAFTTTGSMLTTQGQMNYGGFWIQNFGSSINDYVQFDELRLGTEWTDAVPVPVPEPATISLLCLGLAGLLKKKNK